MIGQRIQRTGGSVKFIWIWGTNFNFMKFPMNLTGMSMFTFWTSLWIWDQRPGRPSSLLRLLEGCALEGWILMGGGDIHNRSLCGVVVTDLRTKVVSLLIRFTTGYRLWFYWSGSPQGTILMFWYWWSGSRQGKYTGWVLFTKVCFVSPQTFWTTDRLLFFGGNKKDESRGKLISR
jgi:hypothetical protein